MTTNFSVLPSKIKIRKIENGNAYVRLRSNITEKEIQHEEITDIIYECDEVEIILVNRANLEEYVEEQFEALFTLWKQKENAPKPVTEQERLEALEQGLLEVILNG